MKANDLNLEALKPINLDTQTLRTGSTATPCSTFIWGIVSGDIAAAESQLTEDVEWGLMPYNKVLRGKQEVVPWMKAGHSSQKEPITITNVATKDWGIFEYWNIGTVTEELIKFGDQQDWPWPKNSASLLGQKYRVAQCFAYHLTAERKIDFMRQYLDAGSVWSQFK